MLTTNGTLLPQRSEELLLSPLHKVSISLHAPEANGAFASDAYLNGCTGFAAAAGCNGIISALRLWNLDGLDQGNSAILTHLHAAFPGPWVQNRSGYRIREKIFLEWGHKFDWPDRNLPEISDSFFCYALRDQIGILCDGTVVPCCLDAEGDCALGNLFEQDLDGILRSPRARRLYDGFTKHVAVEELCKRCGYAAVTRNYHR